MELMIHAGGQERQGDTKIRDKEKKKDTTKCQQKQKKFWINMTKAGN